MRGNERESEREREREREREKESKFIKMNREEKIFLLGEINEFLLASQCLHSNTYRERYHMTVNQK